MVNYEVLDPSPTTNTQIQQQFMNKFPLWEIKELFGWQTRKQTHWSCREIWDTFSPEFLPPAQHHMIWKGPPSCWLLLVEGGGWFTCPDHVFWWLASVLPGLELCGVCLGENGDWWVGLIRRQNIPALSIHLGKKIVYLCILYSSSSRAVQRNGTWISSLGIA